MKGVFLDASSLDNGDLVLQSLQQAFSHWQSYPMTSAGEVAQRICDAEVVISNKVRLDDNAMAAAKHLQLICVAATGTNNVDLQAASKRGIRVSNVRAYATGSVVQHVFALILSLMRRLPDYQAAVKAGRWQQSPFFCLLDYPIEDLQGKVLGILGYGELGKAVARVAREFGMQVQVAQRDSNDSRQARVPLVDLLAQADILSLHCPLTDETRGLIGEAELRQMKTSALLINTARGGIVDEAALATALREGRIAGAGIDVLHSEPPDGRCPLLADVPNLILTPHIAWASRTARQQLVDQLVQIIVAWQRGEQHNRVV